MDSDRKKLTKNGLGVEKTDLKMDRGRISC